MRKRETQFIICFSIGGFTMLAFPIMIGQHPFYPENSNITIHSYYVYQEDSQHNMKVCRQHQNCSMTMKFCLLDKTIITMSCIPISKFNKRKKLCLSSKTCQRRMIHLEARKELIKLISRILIWKPSWSYYQVQKWKFNKEECRR